MRWQDAVGTNETANLKEQRIEGRKIDEPESAQEDPAREEMGDLRA